MFSRSFTREFTLTSIRLQPWDEATMYVPRMLPRPSLSTKSMPPRSAFKNLRDHSKPASQGHFKTGQR